MIKIINLSKKYQNRHVLKLLNYQFPEKGLCIIYGASGSGKTTLLNCIAGLTKFEGSIEIDHQYIERLSDDDLSKLRLKKYGFVFQDFKLFENETVLSNLLFPLETLYNLSRTKKMRKCQDLLFLVGLDHYQKHIVNKLSGGEKQRIAIARALINDPKVLLADEPTGALDEENGHKIMEILKRISQNALVIMVSHDRLLTNEYADTIIEMDDGEISSIRNKAKNELKEDSHLPIIKNGLTNKKAHIPSSFLLSHTYHNMKQKKIRTGICYTMTSLGLIGVGLAFALSSTIANNIKQAYAEIMDDNSLIVSVKDDGIIKGQYAASYFEVQSIKEKYDEYITDVGTTYLANYESFFPDLNNLVISNKARYYPIPGFSARHINEYEWLEKAKGEMYPERLIHLENDQIVLSLNYSSLIDLCFGLQIERTVKSLSDYIKKNDLKLYFDLRNDAWSYSDQQLLTVVGFTLENDLKIYHSNHMWNEYMFEEMMRFPVSDRISEITNEPWTLKKIYYLRTGNKRDELLNLLIDDKDSDSFVFEIANETYYPWLYYEKEMKDRDRLLVFDNTVNHIPRWQIPYFLDIDKNFHEPIAANQGGYIIYPESFMVGFAKTIYFSMDEDKLEDIINQKTSKASSGLFQEDLPEGVISGNYANSLQDGVKFAIIENDKVVGEIPKALDEIVVSDAFINALKITDLSKPLYITTSKKDVYLSGGEVISDYVLLPLKITGIIHSNRNLIYGNKNWTTLFFQCQIGVSSFNLQNTSLSFSFDDSTQIDNSLKKLKTAFPQYEIINPLSDINESVDSVCHYITIVLIIFSSVATLISTLLLTICNYLYIIEGKKEIALARCIGVSKKESKRFLYYHSLVQGIVSFVLASVELVAFSLVANMQVGEMLSLGFSFYFNPICLLPMFVLAVLVAFLSSAIISKRINRINPLEALKQ